MSASPSVQLASSRHIKVAGMAQHAASCQFGNCLLLYLERHLPIPTLSTVAPRPAHALGAPRVPKRKVQNSPHLNCRGETEANKDILIQRPNRRIWGWPAILLWKDFVNLFRRAECYLILAQFCFLQGRYRCGLYAGPQAFWTMSTGIPFGPGSLPLGYTWAMRWDRCL